ncbi:Netrin-4 [Varanus komodoensis]|nr:Netrin-4 [Varanus komodoensis]
MESEGHRIEPIEETDISCMKLLSHGLLESSNTEKVCAFRKSSRDFSLNRKQTVPLLSRFYSQRLLYSRLSHTYSLILQYAPVTQLDQLHIPLTKASSVIPAMVIVPANLEWLVLSVIDVDWYYGIAGLYSAYNKSEPAWGWEDEQGYSALRHSGKCECKDQALRNSKIFCGMKYTYVLKAKILSAHDKGSHAEVNVKIQKVLKSTKLKIFRGKRILYPESWTNRGCTCPILNPGLKYLVAGYEDVQDGKLIVNMKSFVQRWKPALGKKVLEILKECS